MADIFISYSSKDKVIVQRIAALLENKGWTVWWDRQIPIGQKYDTVIETELQKATCVVVVWTANSISSEWVKNEASEAAQRAVLVPLILEDISIPIAFKRIESAMLIGWTGEQDHTELEILYSSINTLLITKKETDTGTKTVLPATGTKHPRITAYAATAAAGFIGAALLLYYYNQQKESLPKSLILFLLTLFATAISAIFFGLSNYHAVVTNKKPALSIKITGPLIGILIIFAGAIYLPPTITEKNITIRIFDWKKNPIVQGDVKIYLEEYIRTQSVDKMGQALFTSIPSKIFNHKIKIEVSSPGYASRLFDTLITSSKPLELTLPLNAIIVISGKIKTAAEIPIKGVEINADGTRYYAVSITDGSYSLRLEEYTLGDEITLTTSHKNYEDKTISLLINAPTIKNQDIFLNPVSH